MKPGIVPTLIRDCRGAMAIEFGLVLIPLLLLILGTIEFAVTTFVGSTLEAAVLEASRYGVTGAVAPGLSRTDRTRAIIADRTLGLVDMDRVEITTMIYGSFADIGKPEPFQDTNGNGVYDPGEPFTDSNGNGKWDADMGVAGLGGPGDIVVYRISYDWGIITPFIKKVMGDSIRHTASIAVRNEPF